MSLQDILIVDDDASIRDALAGYLSLHGLTVRTASGPAEMDRLLAAAPTDLVLLDLMMPGEDGLSVCRRLRPGGPPILMLSALGATTDKIVGLELGADDYLPKPFDPRELLARIRSLLRRSAPPGDAAVLAFDGWRYEPEQRRLHAPDGAAVPLSAGEAALLRVLAERPGRLLSREQLLDLAWGSDVDAFDRAVDLQVSRLRRKLARHAGGELIETIRGEGYRFLPKVRRA